MLIKKFKKWTSLVVQWIRIHLPVQRMQVQSLVQKNSTCCGTTKPVCASYCCLRPRAHEQQLLSPCAAATEAHAPTACAPQQEKPPQ